MSLLSLGKAVYLLCKGLSPRSAWFFSSWQMIFDTAVLRQFALQESSIVFLPTGQRLPIASMHLFGWNAATLTDAFEKFHAVAVDDSIRLQYRLKEDREVWAIISHPINIGVFSEVFEHHTYAFDVSLTDMVVLDVGMNIGLGSLWLAAQENVSKVFGYELIPETTQMAQRNLDLNPWAKEKCVVSNLAWSDHDAVIRVPAQQGGSAHTSLKQTIYNELSKGGDHEVPVKRATTILQEITDQHPTSPLVLKLDCEGEEYKIIADLAASGSLQKLSIVMMEWHKGAGKDALTTALQAAGFASFCPGGFEDEVGMIYAYRP